MTPQRTAVAVLIVAAAAKLALAARWDPIADEAYYAVWAEHLALGYHDQPPAIAWAVAAGETLFGHTALAIRVHAVLAGLIGGLALLPHARDPVLLAAWWVAVPPLVWLTGFGTPDALLLGAWAVAIAGALRGGRGWWVAGVAAGVGVLAKYPALAVYPLLVGALGAWRDRDARIGLGLLGLVVSPHAAWLAGNGFVSVGFQLREGLVHPHPPGLFGPVLAIAQQLGVLTPFVALAVGAFWLRPGDTREARVGWWTSVPLVAFFTLAALGGPPEAHWMAPAWIGVGLGLANGSGRPVRLAWFGVGAGMLGSAVLVAHGLFGVFRLPVDPADRLTEGRAVAGIVASWALPEGVGWREPGVERAIPVRTERYQEAALIRWHTGIDARKQPGCGRVDQYDRWPTPDAERVLYVRPARSGPASCLGSGDVRVLQSTRGQDARGREVGAWDVLEWTP